MANDIDAVRKAYRPTFYSKLQAIHEKYCPELRFGQMLTNFLDSRDPFYWEDDKFISELEAWAKGTRV